MNAIAFSAALVAAFAHVYATIRDNPAAHYANHVGILNRSAEDPVVYRVLLPTLTDTLARLLPFDYGASVIVLHLAIGACAVAAWVYGAYRLLRVWHSDERAQIGCLWLSLVYCALTLTLPGLIAYTPVEAALFTWGLVGLLGRGVHSQKHRAIGA